MIQAVVVISVCAGGPQLISVNADTEALTVLNMSRSRLYTDFTWTQSGFSQHTNTFSNFTQFGTFGSDFPQVSGSTVCMTENKTENKFDLFMFKEN